MFIHTSFGICRVETFCCLSEFFLKQALKAMAQPGEPFKYLGRIGLPLLQLSNACGQKAYCFCCRQWLTESQLNSGKHSGFRPGKQYQTQKSTCLNCKLEQKRGNKDL